MAEDLHTTVIVIKISPDAVQNRNKKTAIIKDTCSAVCGLLNSHHGGRLQLTSTLSLSSNIIDELVRGIEQTLIEFLGLTNFREFCRIEITGCGKVITFTVEPSDRIFTVEYNLYLPTDFLVRQVLKTEPIVNIARLLKPGPLVTSNIQSHEKEFQKDAKVPGDLRESDMVQFKKIKSDKNKNKSLADRIIANKITHYVAAFANHKGGHVYIGIEDDTYKVCGQIVSDEEKQRISEKVGAAIRSMVWPEEHGETQRGKHWEITFIPVHDSNKDESPDLYVIVISIACCPGGVFLTHPEAYDIDSKKNIVRMEFKRWKKKILHDAHVRDIVKFSRENSWKEKKPIHIPAEDKKISETSLELSGNSSCSTENPKCTSVPTAMSRITTRNTKSRNLCMRITDFMEQLIQDGDFDKVKRFASKTYSRSEVFQKADIEVTVRFMLALGAYRRRRFKKAYKELSKANSLIASTENSMEFEVQRLHLLACFQRGEGKYVESYEVTTGGLQGIDGISPGWHSAWMLSDAGYLFSILAGNERNKEVRQSLKQQAVELYTQAIEHTTKFGQDSNDNGRVLTSMSNLLHRCHLRLAMLLLGCAPLAEEDDAYRDVTDEELNGAIANILAVEKSVLEGDTLTEVNECYLWLAKSDLNYRRSEIDADHCEQYHEKAEQWAIKARTLAHRDQFHGIFKYAQSRLDRLSNPLPQQTGGGDIFRFRKLQRMKLTECRGFVVTT